jgi:hypothetical protein
MTIIFADHEDPDCQVIRTLWEGLSDFTLVEIHPQDQDSYAYEMRIERALREEDDTLILAGHGTGYGLLHPDFRGEYLIHEDNVGLIHARRVICTWCYASTFVERHHLNAFATSMFISNTREAYDNSIFDNDQEHIDAVGRRFEADVRQLLTEGTPLSEWPMILGAKMDIQDPIDCFNRQALYYGD